LCLNETRGQSNNDGEVEETVNQGITSQNGETAKLTAASILMLFARGGW